MLAPVKAAASVVLIPLVMFLAGFWTGSTFQSGRSLEAENVALIAQAQQIEAMLHDAARRAHERRETIQQLTRELADYEAGLDGACRLDDDDIERLRGF